MIRELRLSGFKRFSPEARPLPLAPITLLFGPNSCGKSSVLHALLTVEQSWTRPAGIARLHPVGARLDLGRFDSIQHRAHSTAPMVGIDIDDVRLAWENDAPDPDAEDSPAPAAGLDDPTAQQERRSEPPHCPEGLLAAVAIRRFVASGDRRVPIGFEFRPELDSASGALRLVLEQASIRAWRDAAPATEFFARTDPLLDCLLSPANDPTRSLPHSPTPSPPPATLSWLLDDATGLSKRPEVASSDRERSDPLDDAIRSFGDPQARGTLWGEAYAALCRMLEVRDQLATIAHVGGLRDRGARLYHPVTADRPWRVGPAGTRMVDVLLSNGDALHRANEMLGLLSIPYRLGLRECGTVANSIELILEDQRTLTAGSGMRGLPDVGSGVAQILPVLVQLAVLRALHGDGRERILLIEQPEIHLHPQVQARFARVLTAAIDSPESDDRKRVQCIVETHSEHLVLALQQLIIGNAIDPRSVIILAFNDPDESGSAEFSAVRFEPSGVMVGHWPRGFFPERRLLLSGQFP